MELAASPRNDRLHGSQARRESMLTSSGSKGTPHAPACHGKGGASITCAACGVTVIRQEWDVHVEGCRASLRRVVPE